ncbi:hypothetical protein N0575_27575 [Pseudomonas aeruginosa]|nr:hypothetical protein [Pseudomonas aeruginosa]MCT1213477.1 hypothetical protein [Pseudomonas aeruginosa]
MENENNNLKKKKSTYKSKDGKLISLRMKNVDIAKFNEIAKVSKMKKSDLIRDLIKGNPVTLVEYGNKELEEKYSRILEVFKNTGNNINQIAMSLNKGETYKDEDKEAIKKLSKNLEVLINILRNKTTITRKEI